MFPGKTYVQIGLVFTFAIQILEWVRAWFALLCLESWWISFEICLTASCELTVVFCFMWTIALNAFWSLDFTREGHMHHFQQFLYWDTPEFIFAPQIVIMWFPTLKHLLISPFILLSLWMSHMSNQMIAMSDWRKTLMIWGFKVTTILLKIWLLLIISLTMSDKIEVLVFSNKKGIPIIFK